MSEENMEAFAHFASTLQYMWEVANGKGHTHVAWLVNEEYLALFERAETKKELYIKYSR